MGCGCGGRKNTVQTHEVRYANGQVRRFLSTAEAQAAVNASQRTSNPATYTPPVPVPA